MVSWSQAFRGSCEQKSTNESLTATDAALCARCKNVCISNVWKTAAVCPEFFDWGGPDGARIYAGVA